MPKNLSSTGQSFPTQTSPQAGEVRTAASVETPFQNAADRTAYLRDRLDFIDPTKEGVRRIRRIASVAELQEVTDRPDGTVVKVDGGEQYQFLAANIEAERLPFVVKPTDIVHPAPGRWVARALTTELLNVANGVPQLDENAKVPGTRLAICDAQGRVIGSNVVNGRAQFVTSFSTVNNIIPTDTTFRNVNGSSVSLTLAVGDLVLVSYEVTFSAGTSTEIDQLRIHLTKPDTSTETASLTWTSTGHIGPQRIRLMRQYSVPTGGAGSHTFVLQAAGAANVSGSSNVTNVNTVIEVTRQ